MSEIGKAFKGRLRREITVREFMDDDRGGKDSGVGDDMDMRDQNDRAIQRAVAEPEPKLGNRLKMSRPMKRSTDTPPPRRPSMVTGRRG